MLGDFKKFNADYNEVEKKIHKFRLQELYQYDPAVIVGATSVNLLDFLHTFVKDKKQIKRWKHDFDEYYAQLCIENGIECD